MLYFSVLWVYGQIWPFLCQKSSFLWEKVKFSVPTQRKKHLGTLSAFFWSGIGSHGPKMPIFGPKCQFWTKFGRFWAKNPFFRRVDGVKLLIPSYQGNNETPFFVLKTLTGAVPIDRWGRKCAILTRKFRYLGPKVNFLFWNCDFCQQGTSPVHPGLQLSHPDHPQKKFRFQALGHFLGLTQVFGHFGPFPLHIYYKYP